MTIPLVAETTANMDLNGFPNLQLVSINLFNWLPTCTMFDPEIELGFTLAELLIALVILGVIATFTIPKILLSQQGDQERSVLKETIAMLSQIEYQGWVNRDLIHPTGGSQDFETYYFSRMNAIKICDTDSSAQGCWTAAQGGPDAHSVLEPGAILANGASIIGLDSDPSDDNGAGSVVNTIWIDYNGPAGPNVVGQDQVGVLLCYGTAPCSGAGLTSGGTAYDIQPGRMGPPASSNNANAALYEATFK